MNYLAQNLDAIEAIGIPNLKLSYFRGSTVSNIIEAVLPYIYGLAGILLLVNIITSGFKIMNSQGDPKAMQESQVNLKNSALGLLILFASFWIVQIVFTWIGINTKLFG